MAAAPESRVVAVVAVVAVAVAVRMEVREGRGTAGG